MAVTRKREADPPTQLRELERALERDGLAGGYAFRGDERYFAERGLELVARAAQARGLELAKYDAKDPDFQLSSLLNDLGAAPLFSSGRCIVLRNADSALKKDGKKDAPFTRSALAFLARGGEGCLLVTGGAGALRADGALCKAIGKAGGLLVGCRKLWDTPPYWESDPRKSELVLWLLARARDQRLRISPEDAVYLAAATGNDLAALETQLEKLRHGGRKSLQELVGWDSGGTPWKAADELVSGELPRALAAVEALFGAGFHSDRDGKTERDPGTLSIILLGTLRTKIRQLLAGSRARARGASPDEAAEQAGVGRNPSALAEFRRLIPTRSARRWARIYEDLAELDRKSHSGASPDATDFASLALRWRLPSRPAGKQGGR